MRVVVKVFEIVFPVPRMELRLDDRVSKVEVLRGVVVEDKAGVGLWK